MKEGNDKDIIIIEFIWLPLKGASDMCMWQKRKVSQCHNLTKYYQFNCVLLFNIFFTKLSRILEAIMSRKIISLNFDETSRHKIFSKKSRTISDNGLISSAFECELKVMLRKRKNLSECPEKLGENEEKSGENERIFISLTECKPQHPLSLDENEFKPQRYISIRFTLIR